MSVFGFVFPFLFSLDVCLFVGSLFVIFYVSAFLPKTRF